MQIKNRLIIYPHKICILRLKKKCFVLLTCMFSIRTTQKIRNGRLWQSPIFPNVRYLKNWTCTLRKMILEKGRIKLLKMSCTGKVRNDLITDFLFTKLVYKEQKNLKCNRQKCPKWWLPKAVNNVQRSPSTFVSWNILSFASISGFSFSENVKPTLSW